MSKRTLALAALGLLVAPALVACGNVAGASEPAPPPPLPAAPPLSQEAAAALAEPATPVPPAPEPASLQGNLLLGDDFNAADLAGWTVVDFSEGPAGPATWLAQDGAAVQAGDADGLPDPGGTYLLGGDVGWQDYAVRVDAFARSQTQLGLVGRRSAKGYYQARVEAGASSSVLVLEVVDADGQTRELARADAPGAVGRWLELELRLRGDAVSATLDRSVTVDARDTTLTAGSVGLYAAADASARFDNVAVEH